MTTSYLQVTVSIASTIREVKPNYILLANKAATLRTKYKNYYGFEDIRPEFFEREYMLNLWLLIELDNELEVLNHDTGRVTRYCNFTPQDWTQFLLQYDTISRSCYCTRAMFDVDDFLTTLAENLNLETSGGYAPMVNRFPVDFGLTEFQRQILIAPAYFRNALHNNGVHKRGEDFDLAIGEIELHFRKGERIMGFNWANICIVFNELFNVLEVIIESDRAKAVPNIHHTSMTYHDVQ